MVSQWKFEWNISQDSPHCSSATVLNSFLSRRRDLEHDNGHSSDLDQKRNVILLTNTNHMENGTELRNK